MQRGDAGGPLRTRPPGIKRVRPRRSGDIPEALPGTGPVLVQTLSIAPDSGGHRRLRV